VSTASIAIAALAAIDLALIGAVLWLALKVADRVRLVNPVKPPQPETAVQTAPVDLNERRTG
jgi:hypothetical protein